MPAVIILSSLIFTIVLLSIRDVAFHCGAAIVIVLLLFVLLPFRKVKSGIVPISLLLFFTFAGNLFFHAGKIIYSNSFMSITDEGLRFAAIRTLRVFSMIGNAKILTALVPPEKILLAFETVMRPFEKTGLPVKDFFSVMGLTIKAFPALMTHLLDEYRKGKESAKGKVLQNSIFSTGAFLLPVFVKSIRTPEIFFKNLGNVQGHRHPD